MGHGIVVEVALHIQVNFFGFEFFAHTWNSVEGRRWTRCRLIKNIKLKKSGVQNVRIFGLANMYFKL
jgi:hypothetical protein